MRSCPLLLSSIAIATRTAISLVSWIHLALVTIPTANGLLMDAASLCDMSVMVHVGEYNNDRINLLAWASNRQSTMDMHMYAASFVGPFIKTFLL